MKQDLVITKTISHVGLIRFPNPEELNTLHIPMLLAMEGVLTALEHDTSVHAIVVTSVADNAFFAGGNIEDLNARRGLQHYAEFSETVHRVFRSFEACDNPTIAALNGWALGSGMEFMLTIDIRLIANEARIALPKIKVGIFAGGGGSKRLMRQLPLCQAKLLMFIGDFFNAEETVAMGPVAQAVPRAQLLGETMKLAHRIADKSPVALKFLKSSMLHGADCCRQPWHTRPPPSVSCLTARMRARDAARSRKNGDLALKEGKGHMSTRLLKFKIEVTQR